MLFRVDIRVTGDTNATIHFENVISFSVKDNHINVTSDEGGFICHDSRDIWEGIEELTMVIQSQKDE